MSFYLFLPPNMAVYPLHADTWMSLPDSRFYKGSVPFPTHAKCSGKGG